MINGKPGTDAKMKILLTPATSGIIFWDGQGLFDQLGWKPCGVFFCCLSCIPEMLGLHPVLAHWPQHQRPLSRAPLHLHRVSSDMIDFLSFPPLFLMWLLLPAPIHDNHCLLCTNKSGHPKEGKKRKRKNLSLRIKIFFFFACAFQLFLKYLAMSISNWAELADEHNFPVDWAPYCCRANSRFLRSLSFAGCLAQLLPAAKAKLYTGAWGWHAATGGWEGERGAGCRAEDSHYQQRKQKVKVSRQFQENFPIRLLPPVPLPAPSTSRQGIKRTRGRPLGIVATNLFAEQNFGKQESHLKFT